MVCKSSRAPRQYKKSVLISFDSSADKAAFIALYNNIQVPNYRYATVLSILSSTLFGIDCALCNTARSPPV